MVKQFYLETLRTHLERDLVCQPDSMCENGRDTKLQPEIK